MSVPPSPAGSPSSLDSLGSASPVASPERPRIKRRSSDSALYGSRLEPHPRKSEDPKEPGQPPKEKKEAGPGFFEKSAVWMREALVKLALAIWGAIWGKILEFRDWVYSE